MQSHLLILLALTGCGPTDATTGTTNTTTTATVGTESDADQDGILNAHEGTGDADGDGIPNYEDADADADGILDSVEAGDNDIMTLPVDTDGDSVADFLDTDADENCILDEVEGAAGGSEDLDADGTPDFQDDDNDGDSILDVVEIGEGDPCEPPDTDNDGTPDYNDLDADGDGIGDAWEAGTTLFNPDPVDSDGDGTPDYQDTDSDNDGLSDTEESGVADIYSEPRDTDGDGKFDYQDEDADGDGLSDEDEINIYGTDPYDFDTDGDGFSDGGEVLADTDPLDENDGIEGVYVEVSERTDREEEFNFSLRIERGDIAFLLDTTGSMSGTAAAMGTQFNAIVNEVAATFDDAAYAFATFDDYAYGGFGSYGTDLPLNYHLGITSDTSLMAAELSSIPMHSGADGQESTIEALYQTVTGDGYNMDCTGSYDVKADVLPYLASPTDPFGGSAGENHDPALAEGDRGGMGFRDWALPIIVYATDYEMRDPDATNPAATAVPNGCPLDAGHDDLVSALSDLGGYIIGADVSGGSAWGPYAGMIELAQLTGSLADTDGDGDADDELVFQLDQNVIGFDAVFTEFVSSAVAQLVSSIEFTEVTLEVEGDEYGFVVDIDPPSYSAIDPDIGDLPFNLTFRGVVPATIEDQIFLLTLNVIGDGTTMLDSQDIVILVPGTAF
jgi:hypothetical protein